ncbi:MAG: sigma-70 family RNA polymerase sigma factor, partial [Planctomycetes bacterium]|nr:sigma-70 family RNA polymerase sigma factor [Planctomycetota bacterium]
MPHHPAETCWTLVLDAAAGQDEARAQFAARYTVVIEAYLRARWKQGRLSDAVADAVQEVLLETYKAGGLLDKVQPGTPGGFRAFL